jgi:hypothetical protein
MEPMLSTGKSSKAEDHDDCEGGGGYQRKAVLIHIRGCYRSRGLAVVESLSSSEKYFACTGTLEVVGYQRKAVFIHICGCYRSRD